MAIVEVEIKNLKALTQSFKRYPKISEPVLQRAVDATQAIFAKHSLKDIRFRGVLETFFTASDSDQENCKPHGSQPHAMHHSSSTAEDMCIQSKEKFCRG